jgi:hypothetical protein
LSDLLELAVLIEGNMESRGGKGYLKEEKE